MAMRTAVTEGITSPYAGYRFSDEIIRHAGWLDVRFPLSLRMVDELLAACGIMASHETVRYWGDFTGVAAVA